MRFQIHQYIRLRKKSFLLMLFTVLISSSVLVWVWNRNAYEDEDAEDLNKLRDKLMKLKRSHFLNKPVNPEDFEIGSIEQHVPNQTLNHKKLFNSSLDLNNIENCRNTVQGKLLITDERGYTCERHQLTSGGCCDLVRHSPKRFSCESCNQLNCCAIIEYCIACCLQPSQSALLQKVLIQQSAVLSNMNRGIQALFASVTDHFEFCVAKCRTSSQSVQHENSYKNAKFKFCFGLHNGNEPINDRA